jgi:CRP-like cAMP-binding protein
MHLRTMGDGEVFGEIALVSQVPRTADIVAASPLQVLVVDWESISQLSRVYPRIAAKLFRNLASVLGVRLAGATPSARVDQH